MRTFSRLALACALGASLVAFGCQKGTDKPKKRKFSSTNTVTKQRGKKRPNKRVNPRKRKDWSKQFPAPPDVAAAPKDAIKTKSGMAHKLLTKAKTKDAKKAGDNDTVTMHLTVWKASGKLYHSTHQRKKPLTIPLAKAPPGWVEAIKLMRVGEKRRFWMPSKLIFKKNARNAEKLVFEIELIKVVEGPKIPKDVARPPANALRTKSGVRYRILKKGKGKQKARFYDKVTFKHTAWTTKGKMFAGTTMRRRTPPVFPYKMSIGLEQVLTKMVAGQQVRAWIPEKLAKMSGGRPLPKGMLVYDIEILSIKTMHKPPPVPKNIAKPPKDAKKTAKGVFYKVVKKGKGTAKPGRTQRVKVHYTGWTTDGRMFDSSVVRGKPSEFPLNRVIAGWTDGLALMVEGETTRFWIPQELAYKGQRGRPKGMLIFEVQLIEIK